MNAPKLRAGDVVRYDDVGTEHVVNRVGPTPTGSVPDAVWAFFAGKRERECWLAPREVTLLRRPVRIGDCIRVRDGYEKQILWWIVRGKALAATSPIMVVELDRNSRGIHGIDTSALEHADGTPIEPPRSYDAIEVPNGNGGITRFTMKPPGAHKVTDFEGGTSIRAEANDGRGQSESFGLARGRAASFADMVDAIHPADAPKPATTASNIEAAKAIAARIGIELKEDPWLPADMYAVVSGVTIRTGRLEACADEIELAKLRIQNTNLTLRLDAEQKRATKIADECGDLRELHRLSERERDELLTENAKLRRRVERLEPTPKKR